MRILKTLLVVCVITIGILGTYCSGFNSNSDSIGNAQNLSGCKISEEIAVIIAKGRLFLDYELRNYDTSVNEKNETWEIRFLRKGPIDAGYGPIIEIDKMTGEHVFVRHSK